MPRVNGRYAEAMEGMLPPGFLALDLAGALGLPLWELARGEPTRCQAGGHQWQRHLGNDPAAPDVLLVANGGSDLIDPPGANAATIAPRIVAALMAQDYVSGIFVEDPLGKFPARCRRAPSICVGRRRCRGRRWS